MAPSTSNKPFEDFPEIGGLMVSKIIADNKRVAMFMYREKPSDEMDSGWRIFSGYETQEYTDNPDNTAIYGAQTILEIDPSIADLLLNPVGSVFEREDENSEWYEVDDFEMDGDYLTRIKISDHWSIEINNLFTQHLEPEGDLVFVMKNKTVRVAIWNYKNQTRQEVYQLQKTLLADRADDDAPILETFELSDDNAARIGFIIEESDEEKTYKVLYGFSVVDEQVLQGAFYFDHDRDKDWALNTWRNIVWE
ncbi:DUF2185 domain-containing protein [Chryseolinea lacunae]|uniref:DUF2185 domain-containing protein n=1 Tax=Chryseolinea lacunae TaxID=2801331 RepID=A0ABS1KQH3_9BACT|nr:DUF2185 domain-containing protein [Chryseolinea lacunae]MBL0741462.1 DUF2185 domain-containing protein [Chryseolinea lacunae]